MNQYLRLISRNSESISIFWAHGQVTTGSALLRFFESGKEASPQKNQALRAPGAAVSIVTSLLLSVILSSKNHTAEIFRNKDPLGSLLEIPGIESYSYILSLMLYTDYLRVGYLFTPAFFSSIIPLNSF
jgi:hypothetical protein